MVVVINIEYANMKKVHWNLPFVALDGTKYRIDIYAEGAPTDGVKTLVGAATPFTTDESNSDDFFEPVRPQTGAIHIVNTSGIITMAEIMPADVMDRPVVVVNDTTGYVVWRGFLSCEAYDQEYISRPHTIDLSVRSVLSAMSDIRFYIQYNPHGYSTIREWINNAVAASWELSPVSIHFPDHIKFRPTDYGFEPEHEDVDILDGAYLQNTLFYEINESIGTSGKTTQTVASEPLADIIGDICRFFGWCAREANGEIYFQVISDEAYSVSGVSRISMQDLKYLSTNHRYSINYKNSLCRVECNVKDLDVRMTRPEVPEIPALANPTNGGNVTQPWVIPMLIQNEQDLFTNIKFYHSLATVSWNEGVRSVGNIRRVSWSRPTGRVAISGTSGALAMVDGIGGDVHCGAFFAKFAHSGDAYELKDCIYATFVSINTTVDFPQGISPILTMHYPIAHKYSMRHHLHDEYRDTKVKVELTVESCGVDNDSQHVRKYVSDLDSMFGAVEMYLSIRIGDHRTFKPSVITKENKVYAEFDLPFSANQPEDRWDSDGGDIEFAIYPVLRGAVFGTVAMSELAITDIKVAVENKDCISRKNATNIYGASHAIRENEVAVSNKIATFNNNSDSPNLVFGKYCDYITEYKYLLRNGNTIVRIPEIDMLYRLERYYSKPRGVITIDAEHISTPLPLVRMIGYDGKIYTPLTESRDWKTGVSTIQCFETPDWNVDE